jgi:bifunctional non-homologous end joining protein LigD
MPIAPEPMLAATARDMPTGHGWVLQPKYDGWRLLIEVLHGGRARAWTRHGTALAGRLGGLEDLAAAAIPAGTLLDGELVALVAGPDQRPVQDFAAIGRAVTGSDAAAQRQLRFVAFDAPRAGGEDLTGRPWHERDQRLRQLLAGADPRLCAIDTLAAQSDCHAQVVALGFEGSLLKQRRSTYRGGRHSTWRKYKARHHVDVEIIAVNADRDGELRAVCVTPLHDHVIVARLPGRRPMMPGPAVVTYSRVDAGGQLREACILPSAHSRAA